MAKTFLTERLHTVLEYSEAPVTNPNCLGHLAGIGAEFNKPTRNGRKYPIELWRNVMASEDFEEGMETHTLFSETDHPLERIDTSIKEVCAVLTNMEIRENEGVLWVEFDILDTPQGRILKSLIDYGCKIGVSSRGLGDEIERNGETIIDPDTYSYYGHDMVVQPAVKSARPDKVESVARAKVTDIFTKEIESATTKDELIGLKRLAESVNMPNLDSIKESIDNRLTNVDGANLSNKLEEDLGNLAEENENLKSELESLKEANNISDKKMNELKEDYKAESISSKRVLRRLEVKNERLERVNRDVMEKLNKASSRVRRLEESYSEETETLKTQLEEAKRQIHSLRRELSEAKRETSTLTKELESKDNQLESLTEANRENEGRIIELENELSNKANELDSLYEENNALNSDLEKVNNSQMLTENKMQNVSNRLTEQKTQMSEVLERYIGTKCLSEGIDQSKVRQMLPANYGIQDVDMIVEQLSDEKRRLSKLPIAIKPVGFESSIGLNDEDRQTMNFLQNFGHKVD